MLIYMDFDLLPIVLFCISGLILAKIITRLNNKIKDLNLKKPSSIKTTSEESTQIKRRKQILKKKLIDIKQKLIRHRRNHKIIEEESKKINLSEEELPYQIRKTLEEEEEVRTRLEEIKRKREKNRVRQEKIEKRKRINSNPVQII